MKKCIYIVMALVMVLWRMFLNRAILPALGMAVAGSLIIMVLYLSDIKGLLAAVRRHINKGNEA